MTFPLDVRDSTKSLHATSMFAEPDISLVEEVIQTNVCVRWNNRSEQNLQLSMNMA